MKRFGWSGLRPAERIVVCFVGYLLGYAVLRSGVSAFGLFRPTGHATAVALALFIVGSAQLLVSFVSTPGSLTASRRRALLFALIPVVLLVILVCWAQAMQPAWRDFGALPMRERLYTVSLTALWSGGLCAPALSAWLFAARAALSPAVFSFTRVAASAGAALGATIRDWWPVLVMITMYTQVGVAIGAPPWSMDSALHAADTALFGGVDPVSWLQGAITTPRSEWLAFSYAFFALMWPLTLSSLAMSRSPGALREGVTALSLALSLAYVGYTLVPAMGPVLAQRFEVSLDLYYVRDMKEMLMDRARITWDCFPSMHTAGSMLMSWLCWRHARRVFWLTLPMEASTPFACVYLRYHYVVDVIAGVALFLFVVWVTPKLLRARHPASTA